MTLRRYVMEVWVEPDPTLSAERMGEALREQIEHEITGDASVISWEDHATSDDAPIDASEADHSRPLLPKSPT
jgi:hypothetical protein